MVFDRETAEVIRRASLTQAISIERRRMVPVREPRRRRGCMAWRPARGCASDADGSWSEDARGGATPAARQTEVNARSAAIEKCRQPDFFQKLTGAGKAFVATCP